MGGLNPTKYSSIRVKSKAHLHVVHHEFVRQLVAGLSVLYPFVDQTVHDTDTAIDAEGHRDLLVKLVEVSPIHLVHQLRHSDHPRLIHYRETKNVSATENKSMYNNYDHFKIKMTK